MTSRMEPDGGRWGLGDRRQVGFSPSLQENIQHDEFRVTSQRLLNGGGVGGGSQVSPIKGEDCDLSPLIEWRKCRPSEYFVITSIIIFFSTKLLRNL